MRVVDMASRSIGMGRIPSVTECDHHRLGMKPYHPTSKLHNIYACNTLRTQVYTEFNAIVYFPLLRDYLTLDKDSSPTVVFMTVVCLHVIPNSVTA